MAGKGGQRKHRGEVDARSTQGHERGPEAGLRRRLRFGGRRAGRRDGSWALTAPRPSAKAGQAVAWETSWFLPRGAGDGFLFHRPLNLAALTSSPR